MINYYNENDPKAAAWLRELIKDGHIANGIVDERSIKDVQPNDLTDFTQCHFFAGIGGWSYALRLAGWPDDRPVWTGSCPCQPFSDAGQKGGTEDKRHLWPDFFRLIRERRPATVFGEQVASKDGLAWLDIVSADLESADYAVGAADLCAAGVQAPHIRQRLWFVADNIGERRFRRPHSEGSAPQDAGQRSEGVRNVEPRRVDGELGHSNVRGRTPGDEATTANGYGRTVISASVWAECDWIECIDGKWRPVEPLAQQMADGLSLALGCVRSFSDAEKEKVTNATQSTGLRDQVLQALRDGICPTEVWRALGGRLGFPAASILLASMCEHTRELGGIFYSPASGGAHVGAEQLRALRERRPFTCSPQERGLSEQHAKQLRDLVSLLPQAPALAAFTGFPLATAVLGRMGRLRGYGNAIVPQVAAEFVRATMDSGHGC